MPGSLGSGDGAPSAEMAGAAAVSGAMVVFSINNVLVTTMSMTGLGTAVYRLWLGLAGLWAILRLSGHTFRWDVLRAAVPGGVAYGVHICLLFTAFQTTSLSNATIILSMQSGLTLTFVNRVFGERVRATDAVLTAVATAGAALVVIGGSAGGSGDLGGDALAAAGMVAGTAYFVFAKRARSSAPAGEYQLGLLVVAVLLTAPLFFILGEPLVNPGRWDWVRLVSLAGAGTLGHLSLNWAHAHVPLKLSTLLTLSVPVLSTALAWVFLDQRLSLLQCTGAAVTLGALAVVITRAMGSQAPAKP